MINKIINILSKPHLIPHKIINFIRFNKLKKEYDFKKFEEKQNNKFNELGLDRKKGILNLNELKKQNPILNRTMSSEHEILFSSISLLKKNETSNILEIGTYDGVNSYLLSLLFNNSKIKTIDLESENQDFKHSYRRKENFNNFVLKRDDTIKERSNIFFEEKNSINLINTNQKYDLIWIDGAHGYPTVCVDIINSLRLINDGGIILCDDVYIDQPKNQDKIYKSVATFETISALKKEQIINFNLVYKRLDTLNNCDPIIRKFIAIVKKIK
jgi:predicted O-methyltransferase YrrM